MNWQESHRDPLDDLLRKADWSEPPVESVERMQHGWRRIVRRRKLRQRFAIAALVLIPLLCAGGFVALRPDRRPNESLLVKHPPATAQNVAQSPKPASPETDAHDAGPNRFEQLVLEPNAYELALIRMQQQDTNGAAPNAPRSEAVDALATAIERLAADQELAPTTVAQELLSDQANTETRIRTWLVEERGENRLQIDTTRGDAERVAAWRLLAVVATHDSLPALRVAQQSERCPIEVVQAVARLSTAEQLVVAVQSHSRDDWRQVWLLELLGRGTRQAIGAFLDFVNEPETVAIALAAAADARQPPVTELLAAMASPRIATRIAAARVLGAVSDPYASRRLIELARSPAHRREALIALVTSTDPVAKQFIADAQHDLAMASTIRSLQGRYVLAQSLN